MHRGAWALGGREESETLLEMVPFDQIAGGVGLHAGATQRRVAAPGHAFGPNHLAAPLKGNLSSKLLVGPVAHLPDDTVPGHGYPVPGGKGL
jgi:hypothetical protein